MNWDISIFWPYGVGASGERRVLYGEGIAEESQALRLLAGQLLDRELGRWFLHNSRSLQQDVLGEAVESVLKRLFATTGTSPNAVTTGEHGEARCPFHKFTASYAAARL
jgi:hypothetical protein